MQVGPGARRPLDRARIGIRGFPEAAELGEDLGVRGLDLGVFRRELAGPPQVALGGRQPVLRARQQTLLARGQRRSQTEGAGALEIGARAREIARDALERGPAPPELGIARRRRERLVQASQHLGSARVR
jgi:hypothetical protein